MEKLKLNKLAANQLNEKEMNQATGGDVVKHVCGCGCKFADSSGSSSKDNLSANVKSNLATDGKYTGLYFLDTVSGKITNMLGVCENC